MPWQQRQTRLLGCLVLVQLYGLTASAPVDLVCVRRLINTCDDFLNWYCSPLTLRCKFKKYFKRPPLELSVNDMFQAQRMTSSLVEIITRSGPRPMKRPNRRAKQTVLWEMCSDFNMTHFNSLCAFVDYFVHVMCVNSYPKKTKRLGFCRKQWDVINWMSRIGEPQVHEVRSGRRFGRARQWSAGSGWHYVE